MATHRTRVCDRCVASQPYGRIHWRVPVVTDCLEHRRPLLNVCRVCGAVRDRDCRRWARFGCGYRVHRSTGADSRHVDFRVQQAIQAALGLVDKPPGESNEWMLHAAIGQKGCLAEVEAARDMLRDLWIEHRRGRLVGHAAISW
jgi:hypothetical protein